MKLVFEIPLIEVIKIEESSDVATSGVCGNNTNPSPDCSTEQR